MSEGQRKLIKRSGQAIRLQGFRDERGSNLQLAHGMTLFDDEILQQAAIKIAYSFPASKTLSVVGDADRACALLSDALTWKKKSLPSQSIAHSTASTRKGSIAPDPLD